MLKQSKHRAKGRNNTKMEKRRKIQTKKTKGKKTEEEEEEVGEIYGNRQIRSEIT